MMTEEQPMTEEQMLKIFIAHVRQELERTTDELTRAIRLLILAMAEGQLKMLTGHLWEEKNLNRQKSLKPAIQKAVDAFFLNRDLRGLIPTKICLNPSQVKGIKEIEVKCKDKTPLRLPVVADPATLFNHIWVSGLDPRQEANGDSTTGD